jgi:hypothetical protein
MSGNYPNTYHFKPVILDRSEIVSYIECVDHQQYIVAPCASELEFDLQYAESAKLFINEQRMLAAAKQLTIVTTSWINTRDLQTIRKQASSVPKEHPAVWVARRSVFTVQIAEEEFLPFYALDPYKDFSPYEILTEIIKVFAVRKNDWGMAFWFGAANGFLGGKLPKDLLSTHPHLVLAAAKDEVEGITHG